jgi:molybdopterin/thiamine biosynthesis adenylyltransferase
MIGAGGLGSPALLYLAAAGVGTLGVVDDDHVALSNLQRQVLYRTADVGRPKAGAARLLAGGDRGGGAAMDLRGQGRGGRGGLVRPGGLRVRAPQGGFASLRIWVCS